MAKKVRSGSAPNFCPPEKEGILLELEDELGDDIVLEFLGIVLKDNRSYAFFFPVDEQTPPLSSGEVLILEVLGTDVEGNPEDFELVEDEAIAEELYQEFKKATKDIYKFE